MSPVDSLLIHIQRRNVKESQTLGAMSKPYFPSVQKEVVEMRLVLNFIFQLDTLRLPNQYDPAVSLTVRLQHPAHAWGGLDVAVVQLYLFQDDNTQFISGQNVELVTRLACDILSLLVIHQHSGEHCAHVIQLLVELWIQVIDTHPATNLSLDTATFYVVSSTLLT